MCPHRSHSCPRSAKSHRFGSPSLLLLCVFLFAAFESSQCLINSRATCASRRRTCLRDGQPHLADLFRPSNDRFLAELHAETPLQQVDLPPEFSQASSSNMATSLVAYTSDTFRYIRTFELVGGGFQVFNLLAMPRDVIDMPFMMADIVVMPGGVLAAVDLQPIVTNTEHLTETYEWLDKYRGGLLYEAAELPASMQPYFSSAAFFSRFKSDDSQALIQSRDVFDEYASLYLRLLSTSCTKTQNHNVDTVTSTKMKQDLYAKFRTEKDPAKPVLQRAFGGQWTHELLNNYLFPTSDVFLRK